MPADRWIILFLTDTEFQIEGEKTVSYGLNPVEMPLSAGQSGNRLSTRLTVYVSRLRKARVLSNRGTGFGLKPDLWVPLEPQRIGSERSHFYTPTMLYHRTYS